MGAGRKPFHWKEFWLFVGLWMCSMGIIYVPVVFVIAAPWDPIASPGAGPYSVADRQREANQFLDLVTWMSGPDGWYYHVALPKEGGGVVAAKKVRLADIDRSGDETIDFDRRCIWKSARECTPRGDGDVDLEDAAMYFIEKSGRPKVKP